MTDPIDELVLELDQLDDPTARLHRVAEFRLELDRSVDRFATIRTLAIRDARGEGLMTWQQIGDVLGVSPQRAHELGNPQHPTERTQP